MSHLAKHCSICFLVISTATATLAQTCDVEETAEAIDPTVQTSVGLNTTDTARFSISPDIVSVTIDGAGSAQNFDIKHDWQPDQRPAQVMVIDVNNDARRDLFVGVAQGMVNADYMLLISAPGGGWLEAGSFTDPYFCTDLPGFATAARSGPHWFQTYWPIGNDDLPFRKIEQSTYDGIIEVRKTFDGTGAISGETAVLAGTSLFAPAAPIKAQLNHPSGIVTLFDPQNRDVATETQPNETPVTLLKADETGFVIALHDGTQHYVAGDTLTVILD